MPFSIIGHLKHLRKMSRVRRGTEEGCDGYRRSLQETVVDALDSENA